MYILNFVREFVRKCPKPSNFVRRLKSFCPKMSENTKSHPCQHTPQAASLFVFIRKIRLSNQKVRIIIRLKALMKFMKTTHTNTSTISKIKMHKHTKIKPPKNPFVRNWRQNIHLTLRSFLCVFHKLLSEICPKKTILGQNRTFFGQNDLNFVRKRKTDTRFENNSWKQAQQEIEALF